MSGIKSIYYRKPQVVTHLEEAGEVGATGARRSSQEVIVEVVNQPFEATVFQKYPLQCLCILIKN